jgi:hypothetical protein
MARRKCNPAESRPPQKKCIFCGKGGEPGNRMSDEHLWSDWMGQYFNRTPGDEYYEFKTNVQAKQRFKSDPSFLKVKQGSANTKKFHVVCSKCNREWMSEYENAVIPILTPMLLGQKIALDEQMRRRLVAWLVLKLLVAEHHAQADHPADPIFSEQHRTDFMDNGTIPDGIRIWVAKCGRGNWVSAFYRQSIGMTASTKPELSAGVDRSSKTVQSVTWGIGMALFHISATTDPTVYPGLDLFGVGAIRRLWPLRDRDMTWPPMLGITEADADSLTRTLEDLLQAPHVVAAP